MEDIVVHAEEVVVVVLVTQVPFQIITLLEEIVGIIIIIAMVIYCVKVMHTEVHNWYLRLVLVQFAHIQIIKIT
jgi:hypothetical protein